MSDIPICECATFWDDHHPECSVRAEITRLRAELEAAISHYRVELQTERQRWRLPDEIMTKINLMHTSAGLLIAKESTIRGLLADIISAVDGDKP